MDLKKLLNEMSIDEKIYQMMQLAQVFGEGDATLTGPDSQLQLEEDKALWAGSYLSRIGADKLKALQDRVIKAQPHSIPAVFMADVINGFRTVFPIPLAQGCSFNPEVAREGAAVAAKEAAASGLHVTFSPMVDLVRDARWGRVMESPGEDPYLNSVMAEAMVKGYQGTDERGAAIGPGSIAACVKHYAGYGAPAAGRDYNAVELSERTLRDDFLKPYKAAVDAGTALVMTSFNTIDRIPASGNKRLCRDILRDEMGFDGVVISDWDSLGEMMNHGVAADKKDVARLGIEAGVDMDMMTGCYTAALKALIEEGTVPMALLDEAVLRILELKDKLGLFENPYKDADAAAEKELNLCASHRDAARRAAQECFVLLENDGILPLTREEKILAAGPFLDERNVNGSWSIFADSKDNATVREALGAYFGGTLPENISLVRGSSILSFGEEVKGLRGVYQEKAVSSDNEKWIKECLARAEEADKIILFLGEHPFQSGEAASRSRITIPEVQMELFRRVVQTGKPVAVVLFNGRPLDLSEISASASAVLDVFLPGTEGAAAIVNTLFGDSNPSGKVSMSFPRSVGQVPIHYNELPTGRPWHKDNGGNKFLSQYIDVENSPLYPFGFGLSYTEFSISDISLKGESGRDGEGNPEMSSDGSLTAGVTLTNTGSRGGAEVVQLYLRDHLAQVSRPVRELKDFRKLYLEPGESAQISFTITEEMLRYSKLNMDYASDPGLFTLYIGKDSTTDRGIVFRLV